MFGETPVVQDLIFALSTAWDLLGMEFTLYGFVLSFRQIFGFSFVFTFVLWGFAIYFDL